MHLALNFNAAAASVFFTKLFLLRQVCCCRSAPRCAHIKKQADAREMTSDNTRTLRETHGQLSLHIYTHAAVHPQQYSLRRCSFLFILFVYQAVPSHLQLNIYRAFLPFVRGAETHTGADLDLGLDNDAGDFLALNCSRL